MDETRPSVFTGTGTGRVHSLDLETGETLWSVDAFGTVQTVTRDGSLYVGTTSGVYRFSIARSSANGTATVEDWRRNVGGAVETVTPTDRGPVVDAHRTPVKLLAKMGLAGRTRWAAETSVARTAPVNADGCLLAAGPDGTVALRLEDGVRYWTLDEQSKGVDPVAAGDTLYLGSGSTVTAVAIDDAGDADAGSVRWSRDSMGGRIVGLSVADGAVFATAFTGGDESGPSVVRLD